MSGRMEHVSLRLGEETLDLEVPRGGIIAQSWKRGEWFEQPLLEHVRELGLRGLAVDGGANVGNHALWFSIVCGLEVAAFEPTHWDTLLRNVIRNRAQGVCVHKQALGAAPGRARANARGELTGRPRAGKAKDYPVEIAALDNFALPGVVLLKLDIEGWEPAALRGAVATIERCRPVVLAEAWTSAAEARCHRVLGPLGYRVSARFPQKSHRRGTIHVVEWKAES